MEIPLSDLLEIHSEKVMVIRPLGLTFTDSSAGEIDTIDGLVLSSGPPPGAL